MLLANYASDSDSDNEAGPSTRPAPSNTQPVVRSATVPAKGKKRAGPIKITLDLPASKHGKRSDDDDGMEDERGDVHEEGERDSKKAKIGPKGGKGSSSLLGMLPAPKRKLPSAIASGASSSVNKSMAANRLAPAVGSTGGDERGMVDDDDDTGMQASGMLLPPSMARKSKQTEKKESNAQLDLFGLSNTSVTPAPSTSDITGPLKPPDITSAPAVADFVPPPPTTDDPYPGYYQLPDGQWAAYDPDYYHSFFTDAAGGATQSEESGGKVGKHWADLDSSAELVDIQANEGLSAARAEQARKELMAKPKKIADDFEYKAVGQVKGLASERHQLSSLLNTAYTQREELEERIASNKKNARMARTKYGF